MKQKNIWLMIMLIVIGISSAGVKAEANQPAGTNNKISITSAKPGLLIIAHGAPFAEWNRPVLDLEEQVIEILGDNNPFGMVKVCMMEFAEPTIADGIREMEQKGCSRIIAVPLLIAPSSHSHWDIPALMGLYYDKDMEKTLRQEGATLVRSNLPITLTPTLDKGMLIDDIMLDRTKQLSKDPNNEAVIVLAHGDEFTTPLWDKLMKRILTNICGKTGISYGDYAFVHIGQNYDAAVGQITAASEYKKRIIVVGVYLSMGADKMHERYMKTFSMKAKSMPGLKNPLDGLNIATSSNGLLPDKSVAKWISKYAKEAITLQK